MLARMVRPSRPIAVLVGLAQALGARTAAADRRVVTVQSLAIAKNVCTRVVAANVAYSELRLVGMVQQGRRRSVLLAGPTDVTYVAAAGDCVGVERVPFER